MASAAAPAAPPPPPPQEQQQRKTLLAKSNAERLELIVRRIRVHTGGMGVLPTAELSNLLYAFARGIDFSLSAGDVPMMASEVPHIVRKVYEMRKDPLIQSAVMVLVISCKNACFKDWFQPTDATDILKMAKELCGNVCTSLGEAPNDNSVVGIISRVMPRYYPQLKFGRLITLIEAKIGYDILMADFFIERNLPPDEKIRLIVIQKDNLDTSSCITNPLHVSFLVNGRGVENRTNVSMETGPQFPTDITKMLKYGANIIQAVGYFNANYIIAVAFVNSLTSFSAPKLDDYVHPVNVGPADSEVLEGPSRVSLNCPISFKRIKTPIKGRLCKHYQCFDFDNYMEMNLRKPTWRCPYCNTPSNFIDLRIDQKMTKILQETGDDVIDVLVFADGSWKAAPSHDEKSDRHTSDASQQAGDTVETESSSNVIDLINGNDDGDLPLSWASASEDMKPLLNSEDISVADYLPDLPTNGLAQAENLYLRNGNNGGSNMALTSHQNLLLPTTNGLGSSSFGTLESILPQNVLRPVITDAVSPSLDTSNSISGIQHGSHGTRPDIVPLQPLHGLEVRRPHIPRNLRREPVGVQALPVPSQHPGSSRRLQPNVHNCPPPIPLSSPASSTYQAHQVTNPDSGRPSPRTSSATPFLHRQSTTQNMQNTPSSLPNRVVGLPAPHLMGTRQSPGVPGQAGGGHAYRSTPLRNQLILQNAMNQTALAATGQNGTAAHVRSNQMENQSHLSPAQQNQALRSSQAVPRAASPQTVTRTPPHLQPPSVTGTQTPQAMMRAPPHLQSPRVPGSATPQAVTRAPPHLQPPSVPAAAPRMPQAGNSDGLPELPVDENWRPTGQMRGSLTGNAYSHAIDRYLGQAAQQQSQARPPNTSDAQMPH